MAHNAVMKTVVPGRAQPADTRPRAGARLRGLPARIRAGAAPAHTRPLGEGLENPGFPGPLLHTNGMHKGCSWEGAAPPNPPAGGVWSVHGFFTDISRSIANAAAGGKEGVRKSGLEQRLWVWPSNPIRLGSTAALHSTR